MEIKLNISEDNECTAAPYWLIIEPRQMMRPDIDSVASMISGPFFSREEADAVLRGKGPQYSDRAKVFCMSAHNWSTYSLQYTRRLREARYGAGE